MRRFVTGAVLLALAATACGSSENATPPDGSPEPGTVVATPGELRVASQSEAPAPDPAAVAAVARALADFGFDLLRRAGDENAVLSPLSVYTALGMLRAGAAGDTAAQMDALLDLGDLDPAAFHEAVGALRRGIATPRQAGQVSPDQGDAFEVALADSAWLQQGFAVHQDFLQVLADVYDAGLHVADFGHDPAAAVDAINGWVDDVTRGRIPKLFDQLDTATRLALVDAITFTASWETAFPENATTDRPFHLDGATAAVPTMADRRGLPYTELDDGTQVVSLPYVGGLASMLVLLPPAGALTQLESSLDGVALAALRSQLARREVDLWLPRFEIRQRQDLVPVLEDLGMTDAFTGAADLSGIAGPPGQLFVQQVVHDAMIDVGETGTEAAAATGIAVGLTSAGPGSEAVTMHVDRPFVYLIVDEDTGAVLFAGRVTDPR